MHHYYYYKPLFLIPFVMIQYNTRYYFSPLRKLDNGVSPKSLVIFITDSLLQVQVKVERYGSGAQSCSFCIMVFVVIGNKSIISDE